MIPSEKTVNEIIAFFYYNDFELIEDKDGICLRIEHLWLQIYPERTKISLGLTDCYDWKYPDEGEGLRNINMFKKRKIQQEKEKREKLEEKARKKIKIIMKYHWLLKMFQ